MTRRACAMMALGWFLLVPPTWPPPADMWHTWGRSVEHRSWWACRVYQAEQINAVDNADTPNVHGRRLLSEALRAAKCVSTRDPRLR